MIFLCFYSLKSINFPPVAKFYKWVVRSTRIGVATLENHWHLRKNKGYNFYVIPQVHHFCTTDFFLGASFYIILYLSEKSCRWSIFGRTSFGVLFSLPVCLIQKGLDLLIVFLDYMRVGIQGCGHIIMSQSLGD